MVAARIMEVRSTSRASYHNPIAWRADGAIVIAPFRVADRSAGLRLARHPQIVVLRASRLA